MCVSYAGKEQTTDNVYCRDGLIRAYKRVYLHSVQNWLDGFIFGSVCLLRRRGLNGNIGGESWTGIYRIHIFHIHTHGRKFTSVGVRGADLALRKKIPLPFSWRESCCLKIHQNDSYASNKFILTFFYLYVYCIFLMERNEKFYVIYVSYVIFHLFI